MKPFQTAVILAAGESSRFFPFADKNFFSFSGRPLLAHQLTKLAFYFERIFVVASKTNMKEINLEAARHENISAVEQTGQGQAAALLSLVGRVGGEAVVLNNCDIFDEKTIFDKLSQTKKGFKLILVAKEMKDYFPGGYLHFKQNKLVKIVEKPKPDKRPSNMVRLVIDYFAEFEDFLKVLKENPDPMRDGAYEEGLNQYIQTRAAAVINYEGDWGFLKYPWHVLAVKDYFLKNLKNFRGANMEVHKTAIVEGEVYLEDKVVVHEYAKIVGPCYIGGGTVVGNYALIRESMIGANGIVGGYSEVTRSYLGDRVYLHRNYVGDSVLENDILCGAEAVCANFRFDENAIVSEVKGAKINTGLIKLGALVGSAVKIGVNASIMPGIKIAPNSKIMPHLFINEDIT